MKIWYGVLLIALMLTAACGETAVPTPTAVPVDLEATVEAKVQATIGTCSNRHRPFQTGQRYS